MVIKNVSLAIVVVRMENMVLDTNNMEMVASLSLVDTYNK